jgi:trans-AT polyketide synthase, acyltransferase and oxidoreductase domains
MVTAAGPGPEPGRVPVWRPGGDPPGFAPAQLAPYLRRVREPLHVVTDAASAARGLGIGGEIVMAPAGQASQPGQAVYGLTGTLPPIYPEWLGDRGFGEAHGARFPYVAGEMANGIATTRMVAALARAGLLGFFGAAGLGPAAVERAVAELSATLGGRPNWGVNLIHSPNEPDLEEAVAGLLLDRHVPAISASAYMRLTPAVVRCAAAGLRLDRPGRIVRPVRLFAKVSRPEVAAMFMAPAPGDLLAELVGRGQLTGEEARLAGRVPVAEDVTVEADSGGHTDNRPLAAVLPAILALRDEAAARHGYPRPVRVGAAGGLGSPQGVAAAFALGAAYVLTGSVNQLATESGVSDDARALLARADLADVTMAPAADMFEQGVKVQVLRRGTMFAARASRLYEAYRDYDSLAKIPADVRARLETEVLHATFDEIWSETRQFWAERAPEEVDRADRDPRHHMALVFRWYLGKSSRWAIDGETSRRTDYQLWAGPAVGAFNRWTQASFLAEPGERTVTQIALNLLEGAAVITRAHEARTCGVPVPAGAFMFSPRRMHA